MPKIIIVGKGEQGLVTKNVLGKDPQNQIEGFLDDNKTGDDVLGGIADASKYKDSKFIVAIGDNKARKQVYIDMKKEDFEFVNAIHPAAVIEDDVEIGENVFIGALTYINIGTKIGNNTIINNGCVIEHDNFLGDHCHVAPKVATAGRVQIGNECFIGIGSVLIDGVDVRDNVTIGASSNVIKNVEEEGVYYGNPAKQIK